MEYAQRISYTTLDKILDWTLHLQSELIDEKQIEMNLLLSVNG